MMDLYAPIYTCTLRYWGLHGNEATLFALVCYHYRKVGGGALRMRVSTLAGEVGVNERTGKRVLVALHDHGFIRATFEGKKGEEVKVDFVRPVTGQYIPLYFYSMTSLGLKGNDAVLYCVIAHLCKGRANNTVFYTLGGLGAWCGTTNVTIVKGLTLLYKRNIIGGGRESKKSFRVSFFLCEEPAKHLQNICKESAKNVQNLSSPCTPLGVNINKEKEKEKENSKERDLEVEKEQPMTEEEKAKIAMLQQSVMEKVSRAEAMMKLGAREKKEARAAAEEAKHMPLLQEDPKQRAARLMQEAYDKGRAMAATITDRALAERMMAASFHDEPNMQLQKLQRKRFLEGYDNGTATLLQK